MKTGMAARTALFAFVVLTVVTAGIAGAGSNSSKKPVAPQATASPVSLAAVPTTSDVKVELDVAAAEPRQVEETTAKAIIRDYGNAWSVLARALSDNRSDILGGAFVGAAQDKLAARVNGQRSAGLRIRTIDRGHRLEAIFYSPEGSAMQLRDTAKLEIQLLDGETVLSTQQVTASYVALMTVAEDRWKVRLLQQAP